MTEPVLPIDVRPRIGESVETYIRRLARANHLRPSYLYEYLCHPQHYTGVFQPERLAELTGRPLEAIHRALPSLAPEPADPPNPRQHRATARADAQRRLNQYAAIRREADSEYTLQALAARHNVHRRTVLQALTSLRPVPRKSLTTRPRAIDHVREHVNALIEQGFGAMAIWRVLFDEHETVISYNSLHTYVVSRRVQIHAHTR